MGPFNVSRALIFVIALGAALPAAAQEGEKILLWRVDGQSGDARTNAAAVKFKEEARNLIGGRLLGDNQIDEVRAAGRLGDLANCRKGDACLRRLGQVFQVDRVVVVSIYRSKGEIQAKVISVPVAGGPSVPVAANVSEGGKMSPKAIRRLVTRTLSPAGFAGTLVLTGLSAADQVVVDTLPVETKPPSHQLTLTVGEHRLEIFREGRRVVDTRANIQFDDTNVFDVKLATKPKASTKKVKKAKPSVWPFYASVGVAVIGLTMALPFAVDLVVVLTRLRDQETRLRDLSIDNRSPNNDEDPLGNKWDGYGAAADRKAVWVALGAQDVQVRRQAFVIDTIMTTTGGVLVAAGLGGTLFFVTQVFGGEPEEGSPEPEPR
jgi:hypothetical protein